MLSFFPEIQLKTDSSEEVLHSTRHDHRPIFMEKNFRFVLERLSSYPGSSVTGLAAVECGTDYTASVSLSWRVRRPLSASVVCRRQGRSHFHRFQVVEGNNFSMPHVFLSVKYGGQGSISFRRLPLKNELVPTKHANFTSSLPCLLLTISSFSVL